MRVINELGLDCIVRIIEALYEKHKCKRWPLAIQFLGRVQGGVIE